MGTHLFTCQRASKVGTAVAASGDGYTPCSCALEDGRIDRDCLSVMAVREKCDEKRGEQGSHCYCSFGAATFGGLCERTARRIVNSERSRFGGRCQWALGAIFQMVEWLRQPCARRSSRRLRKDGFFMIALDSSKGPHRSSCQSATN